MVHAYIVFSLFLGLAIETALAIPTGRHGNLEHKVAKRNFVPNRFDIVDNEIKHAIQREVQNALRKNFVPNNPLLEANKWGRSSSARYPENQPTKLFGMEYDQINPSRSDPGYLVLDLKKLSQGHLKFHEQQLGKQRKKPKPKAEKQRQNQQQYSGYNFPGYEQYQYQQYYNGYQPNYQQPSYYYGNAQAPSNPQPNPQNVMQG